MAGCALKLLGLFLLAAVAVNGQNAVGRTGATGATGARGFPGAPGFSGPAGPVGERGLQGPNGPDGPAGSPGAPSYEAGATGATGAAGRPGEPGPVGQNGNDAPWTGRTGFTGATGEMGATGGTGPEGERGPSGFPGQLLYPASAQTSLETQINENDSEQNYKLGCIGLTVITFTLLFAMASAWIQVSLYRGIVEEQAKQDQLAATHRIPVGFTNDEKPVKLAGDQVYANSHENALMKQTTMVA